MALYPQCLAVVVGGNGGAFTDVYKRQVVQTVLPLEWSRRKQGQDFFILFPVFGGEMATAKIQTVKGLRVEIFSRSLRKNTTRPLTVWIVGTDVERGIAFRNWVCYNFPQYKPINWDL